MAAQPITGKKKFVDKYPYKHVGIVLGKRDAPIYLEVFLDLTCPNSKKAYPVIKEIQKTFPEKVQVVVHPWIQPWCPQSYILFTAAIGAKLLGGIEKFWAMTDLLYQHSDEFAEEKLKTVTPQQLCEKLADCAASLGLDKTKFLEIVKSEEVKRHIKWSTHYGRQNGIHYSPTFMLNGLKMREDEYTWDINKWKDALEPLTKKCDEMMLKLGKGKCT